MKLRYNPYTIFSSSTTPTGLYARKKWLNQELTPQWKADFQRCVESTLLNQTPEGSWKGSAIETIRHLFGLHLTIREANHEINTALDWLMERAIYAFKVQSIKERPLTIKNMSALPFTPGDFKTFLISATLFLMSIFGREADTYVSELYEWQANAVLMDENHSRDWGSLNNMLRAFVVHSIYSMNPATERLVAKLAGIQVKSGRWGNKINLYQTVNALAHLDMEKAESQVDKAFEYLTKKQNNDGTWGEIEREWNTFLVVHAMKNKGILE